MSQFNLIGYSNSGANVFNNLTITENGAVVVPYGVSSERPVVPVGGMLRYNTTDIVLEYYNGTLWLPVSSQATNKVINDQTASYTLVATDNNKRVIMDSSSATTITINNSVFVAGDSVFIANKGAGTTTIVEGSGVSIGSSDGKALAQYRSALLLAFSPTNFSLYLSAFTPVISASGGVISTITVGGINYKLHTYDVVGTFSFEVVSGEGDVEYLIVAGGGGGAGWANGGGGGGGLLTGSLSVSTGYTSSIVVGDGGAGGAGASAELDGVNGDNSVALGFTAVGGGGGGGSIPNDVAPSGGSGGGGNYFGTAGGSGTPAQGNDGGVNLPGNGNNGGGGGGAGTAGSDSTSGQGGNGGNGLANSITGTAVIYAGGGGGGTNFNFAGGSGGTGGGGRGGANPAAVAGTDKLGGGGGGGGATTNSSASGLDGAKGGSGIVIIRYPI
jgi:hypothetical protein